MNISGLYTPKIGDKVKVIKNTCGHNYNIGGSYIIGGVHTNGISYLLTGTNGASFNFGCRYVMCVDTIPSFLYHFFICAHEVVTHIILHFKYFFGMTM